MKLCHRIEFTGAYFSATILLCKRKIVLGNETLCLFKKGKHVLYFIAKECILNACKQPTEIEASVCNAVDIMTFDLHFKTKKKSKSLCLSSIFRL